MAEEEELPLDVAEQILMGQDVKDLLRWKSVCKSWKSLISSPRFVKAHLNQSYMNDRDCVEFGHRRIQDSFCVHAILIVGSCNGLVCVPTFPGGCSVEFVITNPSIREAKKLATPGKSLDGQAAYACWGFVYDSATDDYKVLVGFKRDYRSTVRFRVLALRSNTWKEVNGDATNQKRFSARKGILCDGALYWFMEDAQLNEVLISFDLSTEEFKEIPLPTDEDLAVDNDLGIIEECLCIFRDWDGKPGKKWVMRNNKWEVYNHNRSENDVAHHMIRVSLPVDYTTSQTADYVYGHDDGKLIKPRLDDSIFVKSLISPHPHPGINNDNYNYAM